MIKALAELYRYRELLYMIAYRDIRIKYKQSIMGFGWALLMPLLIVLAGVIVRYGYSLASNTPFQLIDMMSIAVKSVPWAFLIASIRFANTSLIGNTSLVTKIYFPKEIFPLAAVISNFFDFIVAGTALAVLLTIAGSGLSVTLLWIPVLVGALIMIACGISIIVSAASLFFRDVKYIVEVFLTFGIFFTPVFYDVDMFGPNGWILNFNPIAPIMEGLRDTIVLHQAPDLVWLSYSIAFGIVSMVGGYAFFKRLEPAFAESI